MATNAKLQLKFGTADGVKTWSFSNAKINPSSSNVKTLVNTILANGSIYRYQPLEVRTASVVVTNETFIDLED